MTTFFLETFLIIVIIWTSHLIVFNAKLIFFRNLYESNLKIFFFKIIINRLFLRSIVLISFDVFDNFCLISIQLTFEKFKKLIKFWIIWIYVFDDYNLRNNAKFIFFKILKKDIQNSKWIFWLIDNDLTVLNPTFDLIEKMNFFESSIFFMIWLIKSIMIKIFVFSLCV